MILEINSSLNYGVSKNEYIFLFPNSQKYLKIERPDLISKILETVKQYKDYQKVVNILLGLNESRIMIQMFKLLIEKEIIVEFIKEKENVRYRNQIDYFIFRKDSVDLGLTMQNEINKFRVMIIGAGAIGSNLAVLLATIGINSIEVIDGDRVDVSNLTRQFFYTEEDAGNNILKVDSLGNFINNLNSQVNYRGTAEYFTKNYILKGNKPDLIIQTADKPFGKLSKFVNGFSIRNSIPTLYIHSNLIGPFINKGNNHHFELFESWVNLDSKGLYTQLTQCFSLECKPKYPSISHGSLIITSLIFEYILEFIEHKDIFSLDKKLYDLKKQEYISLESL